MNPVASILPLVRTTRYRFSGPRDDSRPAPQARSRFADGDHRPGRREQLSNFVALWPKQARGVGCAGIVLDASEARGDVKANAALDPLLEFGRHVLSDEHNLCRAADQLVLLGVRARNDERKDGRAVRGRNSHPTLARLEAGVEGDMKTEDVAIEMKAALLIADVNVDAVDAKIGTRAGGGTWVGLLQSRWRSAFHPEDYKTVASDK